LSWFTLSMMRMNLALHMIKQFRSNILCYHHRRYNVLTVHAKPNRKSASTGLFVWISVTERMASDQIYNSVHVFSHVHYRTVGWPMVQDEVLYYTMPRRQCHPLVASLIFGDFRSINCIPMIDRISSST
jgi:hypothetical protein